MKSLTFQNTQFNIVDHNNKRWLSAADIARALSYASDDAVARIFRRNKDEFSCDMTETVKLTSSGNLQKEVRIFSLRGAHLIAMFSRTKVAKDFRKWVLDVLDKETDQSVPVTKTKALPSPLSTEQQSVIKELVKSRVTALPPSKQAKAAITCWSALKSKFGCSYKLIESEYFTDAVSLVARLPLEGEFLGQVEQQAGTMLTDNQLYEVWFVCHHFNYLYEIFKRHELYKHLTGLGSQAGIEMIGHFKDGYAGTQNLKSLMPEFAAVQQRLGVNQN